MSTPWIIMAVIAGFALLALKPPNAAGGGATLGLIFGGIYSLFISDGGFHWVLLAKWVIVWVLIGYLVEIIKRFRRIRNGQKIDD